MAYDYEYPYYDPSKFNVDWLLKKIKELDETVLGLETYTYEGENKVLDLNDLRPNSIASFTQNYNVLNSPISNVRRIVTTEGSDTGGMQKIYNLVSMEIYTRNYSVLGETYTWTGWILSSYKPDTIMHSIMVITNQNIDDIPPNTISFVIGGQSQSNRPTNYSAFIIDWKSEGSVNRLQLWIDKGDYIIRIRFYSGSWSEWKITNPIDLSSYTKQIDYSGTLADLPINRITKSFTPTSILSNAAYLKLDDGSIIGVCGKNTGIEAGRIVTQIRDGILDKHMLTLHRDDQNDLHAIPFASQFFFSPSAKNSPDPTDYGYVIKYGSYGYNDGFSVAYSWNMSINIAKINNGSYSPWYKIQGTSARTLVADSTPVAAVQTLDNSFSMYTELPTVNSTIHSPGQSFFRHDEGEQSFLESILAYDDLESFDNITSNLEMWDMEVTLEEMVSSLTAFINELSTLAPLTEFTLFSLPPIDVPFFGEELYTFEWPNGATLLEIDKTLHELAVELGFNYVDFQSYKYINNTALLDTYGEELFSKKVYKNQLSKYVASNF